MTAPNSEDPKSKLEAQYDQFAQRFTELYKAGQEKGQEAMERALELAREQLTAAGDLGAEQGERFKSYLQRDLDQTVSDMQKLGEEARDRFHPARLGAGALASLATMFESAGKGFEFLSRKTEEALTYHTGELTSAGTLTCRKCGQTVHMSRTGHIPPCPGCHGTEFRKGY